MVWRRFARMGRLQLIGAFEEAAMRPGVVVGRVLGHCRRFVRQHVAERPEPPLAPLN